MCYQLICGHRNWVLLTSETWMWREEGDVNSRWSSDSIKRGPFNASPNLTCQYWNPYGKKVAFVLWFLSRTSKQREGRRSGVWYLEDPNVSTGCWKGRKILSVFGGEKSALFFQCATISFLFLERPRRTVLLLVPWPSTSQILASVTFHALSSRHGKRPSELDQNLSWKLHAWCQVWLHTPPEHPLFSALLSVSSARASFRREKV